MSFDPVHKIIPAFVTGEISQEKADQLVERTKEVNDGSLHVFFSDQRPQYREAILKSFGQWVQPERKGPRGRFPKPRLEPPADLLYAQVVKHRRKGRVVKVIEKVIFGTQEALQAYLEQSPVSKRINTAFVERQNNTMWQHNRRFTRKTLGFSKDDYWTKAQKFFGLILVPALLVALSGAAGASASLSTGAATPVSAYGVTGNESALHDPVQAGSPGGASLLPDLFSLSGGLCPPLPPPTGDVVTVSSETELRNQAYNAAAGTTIMIETGVYDMQNIVHIVNDGITIRGATGQREDVILDMGGMGTGHMHGILIDADEVTIADLTIRNVGNHGVSIQGNDRPTLYNLHILDTGEQLVKVNALGTWSEDGLLACSRLEYTTSAPSDYTNGISAHQARNWVVRDNEWYRIRGNEDQTGPTILFWNESLNTIVERNLLVNCYRGIAFGNPSQNGVNHTGGIVRNNFIYSGMENDVAIEMTRAQGWLVAHNTVLLFGSPAGLTWGMEARYGESQGTFAYNLTNKGIWHNRDGAQGNVVGNVTNAQTSWFVDAALGDLHLVATATDAIDRAVSLADVPDDFDGDARPIGPAPDVGADEYGVSPPAAVTDLRVTEAITSTGTLTATLGWTAPADAVTTTLRYSDTLITEANWASAPLLTDTLPGSTETYAATVPGDDSTVYFALKSQNATGDWSNLSNNAFWPHWDVFLPFVTKGE